VADLEVDSQAPRGAPIESFDWSPVASPQQSVATIQLPSFDWTKFAQNVPRSPQEAAPPALFGQLVAPENIHLGTAANTTAIGGGPDLGPPPVGPFPTLTRGVGKANEIFANTVGTFADVYASQAAMQDRELTLQRLWSTGQTDAYVKAIWFYTKADGSSAWMNRISIPSRDDKPLPMPALPPQCLHHDCHCPGPWCPERGRS
jgi:hypothetical protein